MWRGRSSGSRKWCANSTPFPSRSEEHTSELQSLLSLHDALPICAADQGNVPRTAKPGDGRDERDGRHREKDPAPHVHARPRGAHGGDHRGRAGCGAAGQAAQGSGAQTQRRSHRDRKSTRLNSSHFCPYTTLFRSVRRIKEMCHVRLNLEMAATNEMVAIAKKIRPHMCTLVPEGRTEVTTEGGLDVARQVKRLKEVVRKLNAVPIEIGRAHV